MHTLAHTRKCARKRTHTHTLTHTMSHTHTHNYTHSLGSALTGTQRERAIPLALEFAHGDTSATLSSACSSQPPYTSSPQQQQLIQLKEHLFCLQQQHSVAAQPHKSFHSNELQQHQKQQHTIKHTYTLSHTGTERERERVVITGETSLQYANATLSGTRSFSTPYTPESLKSVSVQTQHQLPRQQQQHQQIWLPKHLPHLRQQCVHPQQPFHVLQPHERLVLPALHEPQQQKKQQHTHTLAHWQAVKNRNMELSNNGMNSLQERESVALIDTEGEIAMPSNSAHSSATLSGACAPQLSLTLGCYQHSTQHHHQSPQHPEEQQPNTYKLVPAHLYQLTTQNSLCIQQQHGEETHEKGDVW